MKRKDYERPTMKVFQLQHKCQILAGSVQSRQATVEDYTTNDYYEE